MQTEAVDTTIWVDDWQMQCCGNAFAVGTAVSWTLRDPNLDWPVAVLGPETASRVDAAEEHHGGVVVDAPSTTGTVRSIKAVHCRYAPQPGGDSPALYPVPGSGGPTGAGSLEEAPHAAQKIVHSP